MALEGFFTMRHAAMAGLVAAGGILLSLPVMAAPPAAIAPPIEQVTADCERQTYATDKLVCSDTQLSALDQTLARMIVDAPSRAKGADIPWIEDQQSWFKRRSLCAFDKGHLECARSAYRTRIAELSAFALHADNGKPLRCPSWPAASRYTISAEGLMVVLDSQRAVLVTAWPTGNTVWRPFVSYQWNGKKARLTRQGDSATLTCRSG